MLCASVEPQYFLNYFPSFAVYHGRYDELEAEDFTQLSFCSCGYFAI